MAFIGTVNFFRYSVMRDFCNIIMAISAWNIPVGRIGIDIFVNIITPFCSFFVDPTVLTVFVADLAVFFVRCLYLKSRKQER